MRFAEPLRSVIPGKSDLQRSHSVGIAVKRCALLEHVVVRPAVQTSSVVRGNG